MRIKGTRGAIVIDSFVPDPNKCLAPISLSGTKVFKIGAGGDYDITGWFAINISPANTSITRWFNDDTTKTKLIQPDCDNVIIIHPNTTKITISGTATVYVEGM